MHLSGHICHLIRILLTCFYLYYLTFVNGSNMQKSNFCGFILNVLSTLNSHKIRITTSSEDPCPYPYRVELFC